MAAEVKKGKDTKPRMDSDRVMVGVYVTPKEKDRIARAAAKARRKLSPFIVDAVLEKLEATA